MEEKQVETGINQEKKIIRDEKGRIVAGSASLNPLGRQLGGEMNFSTKWKKFIDKVALSRNITSEEIEEELINIGFEKAMKGNFAFYRDTFDRLYGKPKQDIDIAGSITTYEQRMMSGAEEKEGEELDKIITEYERRKQEKKHSLLDNKGQDKE